MKKDKNCGLCRDGHNFDDHLVMLAMGHLLVEHHPKNGFTEDEILEKCNALSANVAHENIHSNIELISAQFNELGVEK